MGILGGQIMTMTIEQMRDALSEDEIDHINSLSSRNLFYYVRNVIISQYSDDEVRELYVESQND